MKPGAWRSRCRQCGRPTVYGRAWCRKHLAAIRRGLPTDLEDIPSYDDQKATTSGAPDRPFPFWPFNSRP